MSNLEDGLTDDQAPVEEPVAEDGPVDDGGAGAEALPEPEPEIDYLELDDSLASKYVKLKVDGEERSVPLKEALDGYNSNSVATKRFQEAAELKQQAEQALILQQALQSDPGLTIRILAQRADMSVEEFLGLTPAQQQKAIDDNATEDEYVDPLERKLANLERQLQEEREFRLRQDADNRLMGAVNGLKQQYGIDDDQARAVVARAYEMGVGPDMFPLIYESMAYQVQQQAAAQQTAAQEAEAARRRAAAQSAQATVSTGAGVAASSQTTDASTQPKNPREAVEQALASLGIE